MSIGFRSNRMPIGVEVGGRHLNAIQLSRVSGGFGVDAATSVKRAACGTPLTGEEVARFADVLDRQGFCGREIVLALPTSVPFTGGGVTVWEGPENQEVQWHYPVSAAAARCCRTDWLRGEPPFHRS